MVQTGLAGWPCRLQLQTWWGCGVRCYWVWRMEERPRGRYVLEQAGNFGHEADKMARPRERRWELGQRRARRVEAGRPAQLDSVRCR